MTPTLFRAASVALFELSLPRLWRELTLNFQMLNSMKVISEAHSPVGGDSLVLTLVLGNLKVKFLNHFIPPLFKWD